MRRWVLALIAVFFMGAGALCGATESPPMPLAEFPHSDLQILTPDARIHKFAVWLALDDTHRQQGLMFVHELADDQGMLFLYSEARPMSMWMKNTFISLDMLFIAADGRVQQIVENTTPKSLTIISAQQDALGVLELKGGAAKRFGIQAGARVSHPAFSGAQSPAD